jgi:aspartyl-tRNA(Asn)/glutamyl-tRNA(Gln) amidotransferase subunit B
MLKIFTNNDIEHPHDASAAIMEMQSMLQHLAISKANFSKGSMRLKVDVMLLQDPNVPVEKVSFKNVTSYEVLENCIIAEVQRQAEILKSGGKVEEEVRRFNALTNQTMALRKNDKSIDFRYLADTDIPTIKLNPERVERNREILDRKKTPFILKNEMMQKYGLTVQEVNTMMKTPETISVFENLCEGRSPKQVYQWVYTNLAKIAAEDDLSL